MTNKSADDTTRGGPMAGAVILVKIRVGGKSHPVRF